MIARTIGTGALRARFDDATADHMRRKSTLAPAVPSHAGPRPIAAAGDTPWWRDPAMIPARQFLYGRHYIRRTIGATIAAGGRGKTTLSVYEAVTMTVGRDLSTNTPLPGGPLRAWLLNGEEDQDELDRRVAATCQRYRITQSDLGGRLFVQSVRDRPMRVATLTNNQPKIDDAIVKQMIEFIERNKIDVFMLDPLVSFHSVSENDNGHMDLVIKQGFGAIANTTNSAGELFHHPGKPKPGQAETTVEDGRGASAVLWAVRSARVLNFMTPQEADKLGMTDEERKLHIRIANGKANMGPLGKATWMKIEVEHLPNGDQVACVRSWNPPDPFIGVEQGDFRVVQKVAQGGAFRADSQSPKWLGWWMAENLPHLKIKTRYTDQPKDKSEVAKLNSILNTWRKNKVLAVEEREDEHRKLKKYFIPGTAELAAPPAQATIDDDGE